MSHYPIRFVLPVIVVMSVVATTRSARAVELFDGATLNGWHADVPATDGNPDAGPSFIVRDRHLVSLGEPRGHLITDESYADYRLTAVYRFPGQPGNSGVLVHSSEPRALVDMFPQSIEVQMMHENAGDFWCIHENIAVENMTSRRSGPPESWGGFAGDSRRILNLTDDSENPVGQWNTMVIECVDDKVRVWVNGDLVNDGYDATATEGRIALQAEGSEVEFKRLTLQPIRQLSEMYPGSEPSVDSGTAATGAAPSDG